MSEDGAAVGDDTAAASPGPGDLVELEVGAVAHGGHCVARLDGRVVFVRHTLPGERVVARLTEAGPTDRFWRADAVEVLDAAPDRVAPRCPVSGPLAGRRGAPTSGCGGCDWQHVSTVGQRRLLAVVVTEQLRRLAKVERPDLVVEPVPGDDDGLGWRTRVRFAVRPDGVVGLRAHRSHDVVPVEHCPIAHPQVDALGAGTRAWPAVASVEVVAGAVGLGAPEGAAERLVVVEPRDPSARVDLPPLAGEASVARRTRSGLERLRGRTWVTERVRADGATREFRVSGAGFWQVHPGAAQTLLDAVLAAADPRPGERALDLYCGAGLFSAGLAERVGITGTVIGVESDERAVKDARRSLHDLTNVRLVHAPVERFVTGRLPAGPDGAADPLDGVAVAVLDPPRTGAGRTVMTALLERRPRVVVYVACDPAALARDVATAAGLGYRLDGLRAFQLFPMTHHVECVATLVPA